MLVIVGVQLGFGGYGVAFKPWANRVDILLFCTMREFGGFVVLSTVAHCLEGLSPPQTKREVAFFSALGLCIFCGQGLYLLAVSMVGPAITAIYQPLIPVLTVVIALATGQESLAPCGGRVMSKLLGVALGSAGAALMILSSGSSGSGTLHSGTVESETPASQHAMLGHLILLAQTSMSAGYVLIQKIFLYSASPEDPLHKKYNDLPLNVTCWVYATASIGMAFSTFIHSQISHSELRFPYSAIFPLTYAVLIASALCYTGLTFANRVLSASETTSFWPLQVLVATTMSSFLYNEFVSGVEMIGGLLIISGMLTITLGGQYWPEHHPLYQPIPAESSPRVSIDDDAARPRTSIDEEDRRF